MKNRLRVIRAERRLSQWQLKLMSGVHQTKISMGENDLLEFTPEEKKKIAKALGVSINEIWADQQ